MTDEEDSQVHKPLKGSVPRFDPYSGAGEGSRGYGSASLLEVLQTQRVARTEFPAERAFQSAIELLQTEQNPRQCWEVMCEKENQLGIRRYFGAT